MASTAADIIASAKAEANAARQSAMANLSGLTKDLTNSYNQQQQATNALYQNTQNQLQQSYQKDAKAAYGNYMGEQQKLNNQLTRLGLQNSGYGVSQGLISGAAYSKNLADLQSALMTNQANTGVQQQQALADLYSTYAKNKMSADQFAFEAAQNAYDRMFSNTYQAKQDEISNALQQQYYNYLMSQGRGGGGYSSGGGSGRSYSRGGSGRGSGGSEVSLSGGNSKQQTTKSKWGYFSNGYQPKGIDGHGALSKSGHTITVNGKNQNVWKAEDGSTWYWDGSVRQYKRFAITSKGGGKKASGSGKGGGGFR